MRFVRPLRRQIVHLADVVAQIVKLHRIVFVPLDEFKIALGVLVDRGEENEVIADYIGGGITVREAGVAVKTLYTQRRRCGESTPGSGAWRSKTLERWYSERLNPLIVQRMRRERIA